MADIIVPVAVIGLMIIPVVAFIRFLERWALGRVIKVAMKEHPDSVPALLDKMTQRTPMALGKLGWLVIALAVGLALTGAIDDGADGEALMLTAILPAVLGIAMLLVDRFAKD